jgi:DNA helicase-2/ATP-dependent DNA helicase PcrA
MPSKPAAPRKFEPDERQLQAITHLRGPMLVVAGAGTGKTTVLTRRIAQLIREGHARPDEILAVTYTDNAAREMRERVKAELKTSNLAGLQATTFHAYCHNLLIHSGKGFGVLDDKDLWIYLRRRLPELHLNYFVRAANVTQFLDDLLDFMRRSQDELVGPEKYAEYVGRLERGELPIPRVTKSKDAVAITNQEVLERCREIAQVFATVERMLEKENLGTFGHMITRAHALLEQDPTLLERERGRTRFLLVDEFQDANFAQVRILRKLAGEEQNVFAVGDPDQAIYRFRGASSAAFELFHRHFPAAKLVILKQNRRSTTPVLKCAFALISKNPAFSAKSLASHIPYQRVQLVSARDEEAAREGRELHSDPVESVVLTDKDAESSDVVSSIRRQQRESHCRWNQIAVLYRQHLHRDQLAVELAEKGIPFSIENMDVLDTTEARDLFACLGASVSEADGASLVRVAALPQFTVDAEELRAGIRALPREEEAASVALVLRRVRGGDAVIRTLQQVRDEIQQQNAKGRTVLEIVARHFLLDRGSPVFDAVLEFVGQWEKKPATETGQAGELLDYLGYFREARGAIPLPSRDDDAVRLMTAHSAKGLEFDHVFILRANSNSFPCSYKEPLVEFPRELRDSDSVAPGEGKELHNQEERRLFYVAMTRARDSLTIYARQGRGRDKTPDGFMRDLIADPGLGRWLRKRDARGFQTDLFARATTAAAMPRLQEWLFQHAALDQRVRLSASAVESYETCPLQFKLEREWRIPGEVPAAMQYGAAIHRVLRSYYDSVRYSRPLTEEKLLELFRAELAAARIQDAYQHALYEKQGTKQLLEFLAASRHTNPSVAHTEEFFEMQVGPSSVVGRIDRIDEAGSGKMVITDYKTGKPKSQEDADTSLQLSIYALAALEKWGYDVDHLAFHNLEDNSVMRTRRSRLQLEEAKARVEEVAQQVGEAKFEPNPGYHCRFCAYCSLCPATEKRVGSVAKPVSVAARKN